MTVVIVSVVTVVIVTVVFLTVVTVVIVPVVTVAGVTVLIVKSFSKINLTPRQLMRCSQGNILRLLQYFVNKISGIFVIFTESAPLGQVHYSFKNLAYGRQSIYRPMWIVAPIPR